MYEKDIEGKFGSDVAKIVSDCTDSWENPKPEWKERKVKYIASLHRKDKASLLVSLADKTHNAEAILNDYKVLGDNIFDRFNAGKEGTIWYYSELSNVFNKLLPIPLAKRFQIAVDGFSRS